MARSGNSSSSRLLSSALAPRAPLPDSGADDPAVQARADAELVRRSLAGDVDAFAGLVERYQRRAFFVAYHVIGDLEEARDVAQEAFLRLYRSLGSFDFARNFYTWFYRIVTNLAIDRLRKLGAARTSRLDDVVHGLPSPQDDQPGEHDERSAMVWSVLEQLDAKFRAVLVLRDIHGLSCREIAPVLSVTHATV